MISNKTMFHTSSTRRGTNTSSILVYASEIFEVSTFWLGVGPSNHTVWIFGALVPALSSLENSRAWNLKKIIIIIKIIIN